MRRLAALFAALAFFASGITYGVLDWSTSGVAQVSCPSIVPPVAGFDRFYDFTDTTTLQLDAAGRVERVHDKAGSGVDLYQERIPAQRPITGSTVNGRNVLTFTGYDQGGEFLESDASVTINQPNTVVMFVDYQGEPDDTVFALMGQTPNNQWIGVGAFRHGARSDPNAYYTPRWEFGAGYSAVVGPVATLGPHVLVAVFDAPYGALWVDGTLVVSASWLGSAGNSGMEVSGSEQPWIGTIGNVIDYPRHLTDPEIASATQWERATFGMA